MSESANKNTHDLASLLPHGDAVETARSKVFDAAFEYGGIHRSAVSLDAACDALTASLDALILAATAHGRAQALAEVEQEARRRAEADADPETYLGYIRIADFCRTQREGA